MIMRSKNLVSKAIKTTSVLLILCLFMLQFSLALAAPSYSLTSSVKTLCGATVAYAYSVTGDWTQAENNSANQYMDARFPTATRLRSATGKYNCHSYAWHNMSLPNEIWIDYATTYRNDSCYSLLATASISSGIPSNLPGYCTVYYSDNHSAVRTGTSTLLSKWGDYGLYQHSLSYCPYSGPTISYYTR